MSPSTRSLGRSPATMCRSEALRETISSSNVRRFNPPAGFGGPEGDEVSMNGKVIGLVMRGVRIGRCFADYLVEGRDSFEHFQPAIHAQGQHSLFDGRLLDFRGARALH